MWVKICGLRTVVEVEAAVQAGADAIGLVFARSPRQVSVAEARVLRDAIPKGVEAVAVYRTPGPELHEVLALGFDRIQTDATWTASSLAAARWLPALSDGSDVLTRARSLPKGLILVDGPLGGGRGVQADADRVADVARMRPMVLAGGLSPDNVARAIAGVRPYGVDVSSGVESAPGIKDPMRVRAFVAAARSMEES